MWFLNKAHSAHPVEGLTVKYLHAACTPARITKELICEGLRRLHRTEEGWGEGWGGLSGGTHSSTALAAARCRYTVDSAPAAKVYIYI